MLPLDVVQLFVPEKFDEIVVGFDNSSVRIELHRCPTRVHHRLNCTGLLFNYFFSCNISSNLYHLYHIALGVFYW